MLLWYVDVGYCLKTKWNSLAVSDITFTDLNRPFTIATIPFPVSIPSANYSMYGDAPELQNILANAFGSDFNTIYGYSIGKPSSGATTSLEAIKNIIPSMPLAYPKEVSFADGLSTYLTSQYLVCYRFRSLNKIASQSGVRAISQDGNATSLLYNKYPGGLLNNFHYEGKKSHTEDVRFGVCAITNYIQGGKTSEWLRQYFELVGNTNGYSSFSVTDANVSDFQNYCVALFGEVAVPDKEIGPYEPGGNSGEGGGNGSFDDGSDPIEIPSKPTLSSANTGFTRIYNPTLTQVQNLANYLWTDESVIQTIWNHIKQFFENPMDAIIGFNLVPVTVPDGGTENFKLMYIDTGVSMTVAANQFVDVDCGTLTLEPYYGSALDYSPYTKVSCFLPYVGNVSLNVDEVMGRTLHVTYRVDICSGSCVAYISVDGTVLYQYSGHCAIPIPLSSADFSSYVNSAIAVGKLAGAALIGGTGAAMMDVGSEAAQQTNQVVTTTQTTATSRNPNTGRQITDWTRTVTRTQELPSDQSATKASFSGLTPQNIANTVGQIMSSKPYIEHSGSFSGNSGYLGVRRPYIIIERPNMCMPSNYQQLNGFPSMITLSLGSCSGFTKVQQVQLTGVSATNPEQAEILELLKMGVIF